jgi:predicted O-methyltransferase YrrM
VELVPHTHGYSREGEPLAQPDWAFVPLPTGMSAEQIRSMAKAAYFPNEHLREEWERGVYQGGCTEPWIVEIILALIKGSDAKVVFEGGGFLGTTSASIALTLEKMGGGHLIVAELEADRAQATQWRLDSLSLEKATHTVINDDVFKVISILKDESIDFAWIDDNHEKQHVERELEALIPKMRIGGIITGHDVYGSCDLQEIFMWAGGYALDLPRLAAAGGIGIIQVR